MDGPYKWEPPVLWWDTSKAGSAFGTTAEEGTESPPPLESLQKFIGPADLWPIGSVWNYHAGKAEERLRQPHRLHERAQRLVTARRRAQPTTRTSPSFMNYENARSFFEAWNSHEYTQSFGAIFWMQNNAWPSVHWSLYDYYFKPSGGYFGTKKANEPVHIAYDYFTKKVFVVNSTLASRSNLTATATLYNIPRPERCLHDAGDRSTCPRTPRRRR